MTTIAPSVGYAVSTTTGGWRTVLEGWELYEHEYFWPWSDGQPPDADNTLQLAQEALRVANQLAANQKSALANRIGVINDAIEFGEATPEEIAELPQRTAQLTLWKKYAVQLGRVTSQAGWHLTIDWPVQPTEGMDLSTDPVGRAS